MPRFKEVNFVNDSNVARLITKICNSSEKSQAEIASEMGFDKPNVITMMKQGRIKMPIARIPAFCKATDSDPGKLLHAVLEENYPEILDVLSQVKAVTIEPDEGRFLAAMRQAKREKEKEEGASMTWKRTNASTERLIKHFKTQLTPVGD